MTGTTTNAFLNWFSQWGQVVYITVQMLFWVAIAAAAVVVALQYKRLVSFKVGDTKAADSAKDASMEPALDPFVE